MKTKTYFILALFACLAGMKCFAQQPDTRLTVLLLPSHAWMSENGFVEKVTEDGIENTVEKYADVANHRDMTMVLHRLSQALQDRGFNVKSIEIYKEEKDDIWEQLRLDDADFRIDIGYTVKQMGPKNIIQWDLSAMDAALYQNVALISEKLDTTDPLSLALEKELSSKTDDFFNQLTAYVSDMRENGRIITVLFRPLKGNNIDFTTETVNGVKLQDYLVKWFGEHSVDGNAKLGRLTPKMFEIKQMRIPFLNAQEELNDAHQWANTIIEKLNADSSLEFEIAKYTRLNKLNLGVRRK